MISSARVDSTVTHSTTSRLSLPEAAVQSPKEYISDKVPSQCPPMIFYTKSLDLLEMGARMEWGPVCFMWYPVSLCWPLCMCQYAKSNSQQKFTSDMEKIEGESRCDHIRDATGRKFWFCPFFAVNSPIEHTPIRM